MSGLLSLFGWTFLPNVRPPSPPPPPPSLLTTPLPARHRLDPIPLLQHHHPRRRPQAPTRHPPLRRTPPAHPHPRRNPLPPLHPVRSRLRPPPSLDLPPRPGRPPLRHGARRQVPLPPPRRPAPPGQGLPLGLVGRLHQRLLRPPPDRRRHPLPPGAPLRLRALRPCGPRLAALHYDSRLRRSRRAVHRRALCGCRRRAVCPRAVGVHGLWPVRAVAGAGGVAGV